MVLAVHTQPTMGWQVLHLCEKRLVMLQDLLAAAMHTSCFFGVCV
jgi:hypothetical protein